MWTCSPSLQKLQKANFRNAARHLHLPGNVQPFPKHCRLGQLIETACLDAIDKSFGQRLRVSALEPLIPEQAQLLDRVSMQIAALLPLAKCARTERQKALMSTTLKAN